jgi:hypothetical protein
MIAMTTRSERRVVVLSRLRREIDADVDDLGLAGGRRKNAATDIASVDLIV